MKAWRLQASKINARRKAGSREPNARTQKVQRMTQPSLKGMGNWLLVGLLMRAGIIPTGYGVPERVPPTRVRWQQFKKWLGKVMNLN